MRIPNPPYPKGYLTTYSLKIFFLVDVTQIQNPDHLQADTVAHCENSLSGVFVWSLTITDEYSSWTVNRATHGKCSSRVVSAIMSGLWDYPFDIKSFNTDSGSEFINQNLQEYLSTQNIEFTRSRPYLKNDNCYVEQKTLPMYVKYLDMKDTIKRIMSIL